MAGGVYLLGRLHLALTGMRVGERSSYTGSSFPGGRQRNAARHAIERVSTSFRYWCQKALTYDSLGCIIRVRLNKESDTHKGNKMKNQLPTYIGKIASG